MDLQTQKMNEQQTMMDLLSSQKYLTGMYQSFGNECATPSVRGCMFSILEEEQRISEEDIWVLGGQSNMEMTVGYYPEYAEIAKKADYPTIRYFKSPRGTMAEKPLEDFVQHSNSSKQISVMLQTSL